MNKHQLISQLNKEFSEIKLLFDGMAQTTEIPKPILELAKVKTAYLSDIIEQLISENPAVPMHNNEPAVADAKEPIIEEPIVHSNIDIQIEKPTVDPILANEQLPTFDEQSQQVEVVVDTDIAQEVEIHVVETIESQSIVETESTESYTIEETIKQNHDIHKKTLLGESLGGSKQSIADMFSEKTDSLSAKLELQPISDLRKAININDRFRFQRELFGNNPSNYASFIEMANNASSITEAMIIYQNAVTANENSEAQKDLILLLQRRFVN